ncbi:hypothetical protein Fcan01_17670 [Folsomia candida]|uniref:Uncharacterized protein n=1 Tax=Folsomia candida TaxID=158441 RepID=A0A226DRU5_FOLCA|nr:hypothetical protein Fcan01_17670 [Folsomia candida]
MSKWPRYSFSRIPYFGEDRLRNCISTRRHTKSPDTVFIETYQQPVDNSTGQIDPIGLFLHFCVSSILTLPSAASLVPLFLNDTTYFLWRHFTLFLPPMAILLLRMITAYIIILHNTTVIMGMIIPATNSILSIKLGFIDYVFPLISAITVRSTNLLKSWKVGASPRTTLWTKQFIDLFQVDWRYLVGFRGYGTTTNGYAQEL